jgi:hypothetical protein
LALARRAHDAPEQASLRIARAIWALERHAELRREIALRARDEQHAAALDPGEQALLLVAGDGARREQIAAAERDDDALLRQAAEVFRPAHRPPSE